MKNPPSLAQDSSEFARQLMKRVTGAYASCHSYIDEGEATTVFIYKDEGKRWTSVRSFLTAFVRPSDFRFEFQDRFREDLEWKRYIVWQGGESVLMWWSIRPGVERRPSLSLALAGATGVSGGSAITIPNLLMPDTLPCKGILSITEWEFMGEETVGDAMTFQVHGIGPPYEGRDGKLHQIRMTLWVDRQTLLILQTFDTHEFEDFKTENTTTYRPQMNVAVPPDKLHFDAST